MTEKLPTDDELSASQLSDVAEWLALPPPSREEARKFNKAWGPAQTLELRRADLGRPSTKWDQRKRKHFGKQKTQMENHITPAKKRRAIEDRSDLAKACREKIKAQGAPTNVAAFIKELRADGATIRPGTNGKLLYSDTTIRNVLRKLVVGDSIRKRKRRKPK